MAKCGAIVSRLGGAGFGSESCDVERAPDSPFCQAHSEVHSLRTELAAAREALGDAADHLAGAAGLTPGDQIKIAVASSVLRAAMEAK
jgi:hypothetical protein